MLFQAEVYRPAKGTAAVGYERGGRGWGTFIEAAVVMCHDGLMSEADFYAGKAGRWDTTVAVEVAFNRWVIARQLFFCFAPWSELLGTLSTLLCGETGTGTGLFDVS